MLLEGLRIYTFEQHEKMDTAARIMRYATVAYSREDAIDQLNRHNTAKHIQLYNEPRYLRPFRPDSASLESILSLCLSNDFWVIDICASDEDAPEE